MRLVGRPPAGAEPPEREHHLHRLEDGGHPREPGGRQPTRKPDEVLAWDVDVDEAAGELCVGEPHRLRGDLEVEAVLGDEAVDHVEVGGGPPVHLDDAAVLDDEARLGIVRARHGDEPELRLRSDERLAADVAGEPGLGAARLGHGVRRANSPRDP